MKICFPIENNNGINPKISDHFGSAPYFMIYDTIAQSGKIIDNSNHAHSHGTCSPLLALESDHVNSVICRGMGARAIQQLNNIGITVSRTISDNVAEALAEWQKGETRKLSVDDACNEHKCH